MLEQANLHDMVRSLLCVVNTCDNLWLLHLAGLRQLRSPALVYSEALGGHIEFNWGLHTAQHSAYYSVILLRTSRLFKYSSLPHAVMPQLISFHMIGIMKC